MFWYGEFFSLGTPLIRVWLDESFVWTPLNHALSPVYTFTYNTLTSAARNHFLYVIILKILLFLFFVKIWIGD
jgi:hypothetical protein